MKANPLPTIAEASRLIAAGDLSPVALTEAALSRAEALNPKLDAFIEITAERARAGAKRAEADIEGGRRRGPLHGIPYGLKDIYDAAGLRTTRLSSGWRNLAVDGSFEASDLALTSFGRTAIPALNEARLVIDLAATGRRSSLEAMRLTRAPTSASLRT